MPYATIQDMLDRFGERRLLDLTDRDGNGAIDAAVIDLALADADALIDSYVGRRYGLPLDPMPAVLRQIAVDIAFFRLQPATVSEDVRKRYEDAQAFLQDFGAGKATLDVAGISSEQAATGGPAAITQDRIFSRDRLEEF
ncbi:MAG: DUF1320 domain-containing protein [Geminicoccaceae bacterium]|nr:DUF1320 domain-containing protein [Geminicoccaceae bacterium]